MEDGDPEPIAMPLKGAERGVQMDASAIAATRDQRTDEPVAAAEQSRLIVARHVEQPAERRAHEVGRRIAEHLPKCRIARPDAAVAVEDQDRGGALCSESRHQGRQLGAAGRRRRPAFRSGCQPGQGTDKQR